MSHPSLINAEDAILVVVDIQEKLFPHMADGDRLVRNARTLILGAAELDVPIMVTEQYPKGLGSTVPDIAAALEAAREKGVDVATVEKTTFSCTENDEFMEIVEDSGRDQVVLCGIESHVCVLQTAFGLLEEGAMTYVVRDATESRRPENRDAALDRMRAAGVNLPVTESVLFEMLVDSTHPAFKAVSALVK